MGPYKYVADKKGLTTPTKADQTSAQNKSNQPDSGTKARRGKASTRKEDEATQPLREESATARDRQQDSDDMDPGPPWRYTGTLHDGRPLYYSEVMCQIPHSSSTVGRRLLVEVQHATQDRSTGELTGVFADDLTPAQRAAKGLPNRPHPSPSGSTTSPKSRQTTLTFPKASPAAEKYEDTERRGRKDHRKDRPEARPSRTRVSFTDDKETQNRRRAAAADSI